MFLNSHNISSLVISQISQYQTEFTKTPYQYNWKQLYGFGNCLKHIWKKNNFSNKLHNELTILVDACFLNLISNEALPKLRQINRLLENEINTPFQIFLYDYAYDQEELYYQYYAIFE